MGPHSPRPVHVGCSGWNYAAWRERFYPKGVPPRRWLEHYAGEFGTVEVNATFYRLASPTVVTRWIEQTPPGFVFALKASRYRHESWFAPEVMTLLREHGVALVIGDHPERPFQTHERTTDWTLIRFHHGARGRRGNYSEAEIATWARRVAQWRRDTEVFAFFNNDWEAFAIQNARSLKRRLGVQLTPATTARR